MKKEYFACPEPINEEKLYGFSWLENVLAIPSPLVCVTSYKENGMPNAAMQSWCTFDGTEGYHIILSSVNKHSHMYSSVMKTKQFAVNFPSRDVFMKCMATIQNNDHEKDEITSSGLTAVAASKIKAPLIEECFLNLECELSWTKETVEGGDHYVFCAKVIGIHMDEERLNSAKLGRYGETGYLYNIHNPIDPDTGKGSDSQVGIIQSLGTYDKL
ncbi:MAG: flavin reductase family protein [Oscillospiraceae bacterium]|nr:flavin reductase family protein [Oscillospiraceae bacterium]